MVLSSLSELATGFEGCEKKLEIDFHLTEPHSSLRQIPRSEIDSMLDEAKCTIISVQKNRDFDAYVLSESSLFVYPSKMLLKTCGTTLLLKSVKKMLSSAAAVGANPDFLQFSRSNFLFPHKQHFPHRAFGEETDYLNEELGITGEAYILGSLNGARWHLYIWDFNRVSANEYRQQTLELIMFNLDPNRMKTFYNATANEGAESEESKEESRLRPGKPTRTGEEATIASGIDKLMPGAKIDANLFNPCGYSCNGCVEVENSADSAESADCSADERHGKQGKDQQAYFTIHITPEPECSFVSFETNAVLPSYTKLVRSVVNTFRPGSFCVSLFVDGKSDVADSRVGLDWEFRNYITKGTTHHAFPAGYNATCSQFEQIAIRHDQADAVYGDKALSEENITGSPLIQPANSSGPLSAQLVLHGLPGLGVVSSYETVSSLSLDQMRALAFQTSKEGKFNISMDLQVNDDNFNLDSTEFDSLDNNEAGLLTAANKFLSDSKLKRLIDGVNSFNLIDIGQLVRRFYQWTQTFGRIEPIYSVPFLTSIPSGVAIILSALGCSFACPTQPIFEYLLKLGVPASRILFDRAVKNAVQLQFAKAAHVDFLTAANLSDLELIHSAHPKAKVMLHIATPCNNSNTRGALQSEIAALLQRSRSLDVSLVGVKFDFHRSAAATLEELRAALNAAKEVFDKAEEFNYQMRILDMGIGLPNSASAFASELKELLDELFNPVEIRILADPVAFFDRLAASSLFSVVQSSVSTASSASANANAIADSSRSPATQKKRKPANSVDSHVPVSSQMLFVSENVKNFVSSGGDKKAKFIPVNHKQAASVTATATANSTFLSADSAETICTDVSLPIVAVGDWLFADSSIAQAMLSQDQRLFYIAS